jgi:hypothetical protein
MIVHLVNYNAGKIPALDPVEVTCHIPAGESVKAVRVVSPDADGLQTVGMKSDGSTVNFRVPVKAYSMAVVEW